MKEHTRRQRFEEFFADLPVEHQEACLAAMLRWTIDRNQVERETSLRQLPEPVNLER